jgi:hypothetical protein
MNKRINDKTSAGANSGFLPHSSRVKGVEGLFGLKRRFLDALRKSGDIESCALSAKGGRPSIRLIALDSVRNYLRAAMKRNEQKAGSL